MSAREQDDWRRMLQGHPPGTVLAYERFLETGDFNYLDTLTLEILRYYHPDPSSLSPEEFTDTSHINRDLGLDSVSMVEAVFLMEDLLGITIRNEDLEKIGTLGELKAYLREKLKKSPKSYRKP